MLPPGRIWKPTLSATPLVPLLLTVMVGAGGIQGSLGGASFVHISMYDMTTGGFLATAAGNRVLAPRTTAVQFHDHRSIIPRIHGLPSALTGTASFTPEGNSAVAAHQRYQKDAGSSWMWGNGVTLNPKNNNTLEAGSGKSEWDKQVAHIKLWGTSVLCSRHPGWRHITSCTPWNQSSQQ